MSTRTPCPNCGNPSDAAKFVAAFLRGNMNPAIGHLFAAAHHEAQEAQDRADRSAARVTTAFNTLEAEQRVAVAARSRADAELADAAKADSLPVVVADHVRTSAAAAVAAADAAETAVKDADAALVALKAEAIELTAVAGLLTADAFSPDDLQVAFDELGVVEAEGGNIFAVDTPSAEQVRTRSLLNFLP